MNINLDVNELVEQLIQLTKHQNEAMTKAEKLSEQVYKLERELDIIKTKELDEKLARERDLDEMAKYHEMRELDQSLRKLSNG